MCARTTRLIRKKGTDHPLLEQEVHGMRDELLFAQKDMLCPSVDSSLSEAVHAELYHLVGVQNGSSQVHL